MGSCVSASTSDSEDDEPPRQVPPPAVAATPTATAPGPSLHPLPLSSSRTKGKNWVVSRPESIAMKPALDALRKYAALAHPSSALPPSTLLLSTPQTIAIFDAFPKAKYHFLVLPRYPFPPQSDPDSRTSLVQLDAFDDLRSLLKTSPDIREQVIDAMADTAREVEEMIRDEMIKTEGWEWRVDIGFHAIPSMKHVHLHVISEDRISDKLKTKKHHNSFRPDLGFFVSIMDVQRWIQEDEESIRQHVETLSSAETLLNTPLTCFKCDEPFHNMPKLKQHLEKEFEKEGKEALKRIAKHGRQRSSDEDIF